MNLINKLVLKIFYKNPKKISEFYKKQGYRIGDKCEIYKSVSFGSEPYLVSIGNKSKITNQVSFITHDGGMHVLRNLGYIKNGEKFGSIKIGDNVFIGNKVTLLPGISIGDNCIIGAGSIVTKNFEKNSIIAGIPARKISDIESYFEKNKNKIIETKHLDMKSKEKILKKNSEVFL